MIWVNLFHIYQPPNWEEKIIKKVARESYQPLFEILQRNPKIKITLNINASLTEQLVKYNLSNIIKSIKFLAERGQIEFTHTAKYHPILPLLPEEIITRQIKLNEKVNKKFFGEVYKPKGFFPPEMSWGDSLIKVLEKLGINWVILDEISFNKKIGEVNFEQGYRIKNTKINVIFRSRTISNYFAFEVPPNNPKAFFEKVEREKQIKNILITAMDGENLGHHRKDTEKLWEKLVTRKEVKTTLCSELIDSYQNFAEIIPKPGSWSTEEDDSQENIPFSLWQNPKNPIQVKQWILTKKVIEQVQKAKEVKDKNYKEAENLLDRALASDQYWWASMRPWWSKEIIIRETEELFKTLEPLKNISIEEREEVNQLVQEIISLVNEWQESGKAEEISREYMKKVGFIPHLGGKKVTNH